MSEMAEEAKEIEIKDVVPVDIKSPVLAKILPSVSAGMQSTVVSQTEATKIAHRDARRRRLVIFSADQPIYIGTSQQEAATGEGFLLRDHFMLELTCVDEVWAICSATGQTTIVSTLAENWIE